MDDYKRREFIKLSALGFAGIALQLNSISSYAQSANAHLGKWNADTKLNWDAFLERITQLAKTQHQLPWDQGRYTEQVKQLLLQCNFSEFENFKKELDAYEDKTPNRAEAVGLHDEVDFQISLFQFEKGEYIPHHDHPDMTGVINVVSGNVLARNYSLEEQLATTREVITHGRKNVMQKCVIKEVENKNIMGGDVSILTAHEGNIHSIMPMKYTQMVDVFTPAYTQDTSTIWYMVNEDGFYQDRENLFEAEYQNKDLSEVHAIELSPEQLNQYVGSYQIGDEFFIKISRTDMQLVFERTKSLETPGRQKGLIPYEAGKFWMEDQDIRCVFEVDNKQAAQSLTLYFGDTSMTAKRIK